MDIRIGNNIKAYSTEELIDELKRRGATNTVIVDSPSTHYYVSIPGMNKEIVGYTNPLSKDKVMISVTILKNVGS